jgi:hypothetical protein
MEVVNFILILAKPFVVFNKLEELPFIYLAYFIVCLVHCKKYTEKTLTIKISSKERDRKFF